MISKTLAAGLIAAGCVTAAGGGAYLAVRQNTAEPVAAAAPVSPSAATPTADPGSQSKPVSETEAIITTPEPRPEVEPPVERESPAERRVSPARPVVNSRAASATPRTETRRNSRSVDAPRPNRELPRGSAAPDPAPAVEVSSPAPVYSPLPAPEPPRAPEPPPAPPEPQFEEVVVPAASVIGLQVDTPLSSERARIEDRVDARVTRDVLADGRVAIPAGARVIGAVTLVERGGKVKERARLGVRFHTLVLADGSQIPLRTEAIVREGEAPSGESARKIGGAAIGGAILGAIMGGGKGAIVGGATGAGAGTAAVMAGDRNAATLPAGTVVTVRLASPASIEVEKR